MIRLLKVILVILLTFAILFVFLEYSRIRISGSFVHIWLSLAYDDKDTAQDRQMTEDQSVSRNVSLWTKREYEIQPSMKPVKAINGSKSAPNDNREDNVIIISDRRQASSSRDEKTVGSEALTSHACYNMSGAFNYSTRYNDSLTSDDWQTVVPTVLYVYSAHSDPRYTDRAIIRIFGLMLRSELFDKDRKPYYCQLYDEQNGMVYVRETAIIFLRGHDSSKFKMVIIECPHLYNPWTLPQLYVSITRKICVEANNHLIVRQNYVDGFKTNFTLCLDGVLKHGVDDHARLIEWIELNRLLGAEHIFIYNFSGSASLQPYLKYYQDQGLLTVLPWNLPLKFREDEHEFSHDFFLVWNYGQRTMIHDCLYRNMFVARHLVYLDLDEFIIPQEDDVWTWQEMLERAKVNCTDNMGSFIVRNGLFEMNLTHVGSTVGDTRNNNTRESNSMPDLIIDRYIEMYVYMKPAFHRSKYILIPERVLDLNIHHVQHFLNTSYQPCVLSPSVGHLHHYKIVNSIQDTKKNIAATKFRTALLERVLHVYNVL